MTPKAAATCRHCGSALSAPQRLTGHCGAAGCRHREKQARQARLEKELGAPALQAAQARLGRRATLLWLGDGETRLVPVPKARRSAHRAHLMRLIEAPIDETVQPLAPAPPPSARGEQEGRLCGQCRGRCCSQGAPTHAFITLPQLLRWQQRDGARSLQDAADWYLAQIPPRHSRNSCVYHGPQGCVLPRGDRADICNSYACDALLQVQQELKDDAGAVFVAVTLKGDEAVRRAVIGGDGTQPL